MNKLVILIAAAMVLGTVAQLCRAEQDTDESESSGQPQKRAGRILGTGWFTNHIDETPHIAREKLRVGVRADKAYMHDVRNKGSIPLVAEKEQKCKTKKSEPECIECCQDGEVTANGRIVRSYWFKKSCSCESRDNSYADDFEQE